MVAKHRVPAVMRSGAHSRLVRSRQACSNSAIRKVRDKAAQIGADKYAPEIATVQANISGPLASKKIIRKKSIRRASFSSPCRMKSDTFLSEGIHGFKPHPPDQKL